MASYFIAPTLVALATLSSANPLLPCPNDWLVQPFKAYPDLSQPNAYYMCGRHGVRRKLCPPGQFFSKVYNKCFENERLTHFQCPLDWEFDAFNAYPDDFSRNHYNICGHGGAIRMRCPIDCKFSTVFHQCIRLPRETLEPALY